jgi:hypothetical protein
MLSNGVFRVFIAFAVVGFLLFAAAVLQAGETDSVAMITCIKKDLQVKHRAASLKGKVGMEIFEGDTLITGPGCQAVLMLGDGSELKLNEKTEIRVTAYNAKKKSFFVQMGEIFCKFLAKKSKVTIETPQGEAGIEGTEFTLKVGESTNEVTVGEGEVSVGAEKKKIKPGQKGRWNNRKCDLEAGKYAPWVNEIREYAATLKEINDEYPNLGNGDHLGRLTQEKLQTMVERQKNILKELEQITPPEQMTEIHKELIEVTALSVDGLNTLIGIKKQPGNRQLRLEYRRQLGEYMRRWIALAREVKVQAQKLKKEQEQFREKYASTSSGEK